MAYNAGAEQYSKAAAVPWYKGILGISYPDGWSHFDQIYSEIADATDLRRSFKTSDLVGQLPSIMHLAPKSQGDIIRVVVRDMLTLGPEADGLQRVGGMHRYQWRFAALESA